MFLSASFKGSKPIEHFKKTFRFTLRKHSKSIFNIPLIFNLHNQHFFNEQVALAEWVFTARKHFFIYKYIQLFILTVMVIISPKILRAKS